VRPVCDYDEVLLNLRAVNKGRNSSITVNVNHFRRKTDCNRFPFGSSRIQYEASQSLKQLYTVEEPAPMTVLFFIFVQRISPQELKAVIMQHSYLLIKK